MSSRRTAPPPMQQLQPQMSISYGEPEKKPRSKCMSFVCCMWKVFTCIFSHVTLVATVVAYCFLGAFTFEHLEAENERNVSKPQLCLEYYCIPLNTPRFDTNIWKHRHNSSVLIFFIKYIAGLKYTYRKYLIDSECKKHSSSFVLSRYTLWSQ